MCNKNELVPWNIVDLWYLWLCLLGRFWILRWHMPNLHSVGEMIQGDPSNVWNLRTKSTSRRSFGNHLISFWAMCL